MKNKFLLFLNRTTVVLLLVCSLSLTAQVNRSKMPEPGPAPEIQLGEFESFELDNGLKVFVVQNDKLPVVSYSLVLDRDPIIESENAGYVSIAGQLLRTGTTTKTKAEIDEAVDFIGASLSTSSTNIYGSSLKKHTDTLLAIMSDIVLNAEFRQEELDKIKKQTISALQAEKDDPESIAANVRNALVYGKNHPYGEQVTEETVNNITLEMCRNYYEQYFSPSIAYLAVVGDITVAEAEELIKKYFGTWESKTVPSADYPEPKKPLVNKVALVDRPQSVQSVVQIAYPVNLKIGAEDAIKTSVANMILGGYFSSKLNQNLREDKAYTYGAGSSISSDPIIGRFNASAQVRNEVTDSTITEILNEMKKMRNGDFTDDELQMAKTYITGSFARSLEDPKTIARFALNIEQYDLPEDYYQNYLKNVNEVTNEDVIEVSKKYINPDNAYIIVVGKAEEVADALTKFSLSGKINYYDIYGNEYDPSAKEIPEGVTVKTVLEKYTEAMGGEDALRSIEDIEMILKGKIQGMDVTLTISRKAPDKLYQMLDAGVFKQTIVFDGEKGKQVANAQETVIEGDQLENLKMQSTMNLFLNYEQYGIEAKLKGIKDVNGTDAYEVELVLPSGKKWYHYYDPETGFRVREVSTIETPQGSFNQTIDMADYREVENRMFPFKLVQQLGPQNIEMEVSSIKINQGLSESMFEVE